MFKKAILLIPAIGACVNAQTITQIFGNGANTFSIDFVEIGNAGNEADTTGDPNPAGRVDYIYNLGKYEISRDMINKANLAAGIGISLADMTNYSGNGENRPATGISWYEAAGFINYLNTSQGYHVAYNLIQSPLRVDLWDSADAWQIGGENLLRHKDAYYFLPNENEWYKGAYGSPSGAWYNFPTGSDSAPAGVSSGTDADTAIYGRPIGPSDITSAGGLSGYGTMGQGGNVYEWSETAVGDSQILRGGAWDMDVVPEGGLLSSSVRDIIPPWLEDSAVGFRVASVPEPSALLLLAVGLGGLALVRRRRA